MATKSSTVFINAAQVYFVKCNPEKPSTKMDKNKPQWEAQVRTTDNAVVESWRALGLEPKFQIPAGKAPTEGFYRCNFSKRAFKKDGSPAVPIEAVTGDLRPIDPDIIGNGSTVNIRLYAREGIRANGRPATFFTLAGIQVLHLIPYKSKSNGFRSAGFSADEPADDDEEGMQYDQDDDGFGPAAHSVGPAPGAPVAFTPPVNAQRSPSEF